MCVSIATSELTPENVWFCVPPMPMPVSEVGGFLAAYFLNTLLKLKDAISISAPSILLLFHTDQMPYSYFLKCKTSNAFFILGDLILYISYIF